MGALVLAAISVLWSIVLSVRLSRVGGARRPGAAPGGDGSLDATLDAHDALLRDVGRDVAALAARTEELDTRARRAVQRVGLVRFNPFADTGSNQSFALVLLDEHGNGVALSSLHSRQTTRIYAKPIIGGRSDAALSDEETEALRQAQSRDRSVTP